ncbi:S8 family peptidase [Winogradskyella maritima]|uniref:S8 family peptidase n=1 Tax=Winogradskyella maritima TaxID=1517766 RepID=A0ABV8AIQ8_9FLAO|nr:S8 family peptidase [Winogradskyella maritima]
MFRKYIVVIFLLHFGISISGQTETERKEIISTYDKNLNSEVTNYLALQNQLRKDRINNYLSGLSAQQMESIDVSNIRDISREGKPMYYVSFNDDSAQTIRANALHPGGALNLNLTGQGITAGLWEAEDGYPQQFHLDLNGRINIIDGGGAVNFHATHVAGTIISSGNNSASNSGRGIAYNASLNAYTSDNDNLEMSIAASAGLLLSNHSYGFRADNLPQYQFGKYTQGESLALDITTSTYPYYLPVVSAGNDRNNTIQPGGYNYLENNGFDLLTGLSTAKNGITSAAVNEVQNYTGPFSVQMSSFSNWGPTDDGRIKPDISSQGVNVLSTSNSSLTGYGNSSGTSMSAPAITGLLILLQEHYNNINSQFMLAATVKGLLLHTADETGVFKGPDYRFGWGLANGEKAALAISNNNSSSYIEESTLLNLETKTFDVVANGAEPLMVSLSWTDPAPNATFFGGGYATAVDDATPVLVNDLDIKLTKDGVDSFPWKLGLPASLGQAASRNTTNDVDNFEKVEVDSPSVGDTYTVTINHKGVLDGAQQNYSIIVTGGSLATLSANDISLLENSFKVYPIPAQNIINTYNGSAYEIEGYKIYDAMGRLALHGKFEELIGYNTIDIGKLNNGVYFIEINTDIGILTKRIIKAL